MSNTIIKLLIPEEAEGERLDHFLADVLPQYSREYLKSLILDQQVSIDNKSVTKPAFRVLPAQEILLNLPEMCSLSLEPEAIPLEIVFEDQDLLVVNKPSGMLTHPTGKERHGTLVNALLTHCDGQLSGINGVERPGIVHRLDRETSGLMMVAKSDLAHRSLQRQLQERSAKRCYRAIVQGILAQTIGIVDAPIDRNPKKRDKMAVLEGGRAAITRWEVLETIGDRFSILKLSLETGRTHQIRVHMAHIGHPVFGDPVYGTGLEKLLGIHPKGQILQAFQLAFRHPVDNKPLQFEIPADEKFKIAQTFLEQWIQ
jgi:23S rRNA pseudouridine1911/1915/1917 synthase